MITPVNYLGAVNISYYLITTGLLTSGNFVVKINYQGSPHFQELYKNKRKYNIINELYYKFLHSITSCSNIYP